VLAVANAAIVLFLYGGLGLLGLMLSRKLGFAEVVDPKVSNQQRFLLPVVIGAGVGVLAIVSDLSLSRFNPLGAVPHPGFPSSILAAATAGIGEETLWRCSSSPSGSGSFPT
jgi:hypothetical protein